MKKSANLGESPRTWVDRFWFVMSWGIFAFLAVGFYSYQPGKASLLNELTGYVLLLSWVLILGSILRAPRQPSTSTKAGDIRENPWEALKTFAMLIALAMFCFGAIYAGVIAFWSNKVLYWPGGRGKPSLYVFWSDSTVLAFAMTLTWLLLGVMMGWGLLNAYLVTNNLPKWGEVFSKNWKIK